MKGKEEPRSVINVRSLITHDDVKSGVNLSRERQSEGGVKEKEKKLCENDLHVVSRQMSVCNPGFEIFCYDVILYYLLIYCVLLLNRAIMLI